MMGIPGIVALNVTGVALLLDIIGLAIPYWLYRELFFLSIVIKYHVGLWKECIGKYCETFTESTPWFDAVRAMVLIGMILLIASLVCGLLKMTVMKDHASLPQIAGVFSLFAGIFIIIGCIIFAAKTKDEIGGANMHLHASFGLCIVAGIVGIAAAVLFFIDCVIKRENVYDQYLIR